MVEQDKKEHIKSPADWLVDSVGDSPVALSIVTNELAKACKLEENEAFAILVQWLQKRNTL